MIRDEKVRKTFCVGTNAERTDSQTNVLERACPYKHNVGLTSIAKIILVLCRETQVNIDLKMFLK